MENSRTKYPSTPHLQTSPGFDKNDIRGELASYVDYVIVTEKMDGENTSLYSDGYVHARSVLGTGKEYQDWAVAKWRSVCHLLRPGWRICAENLYAEHSIRYENLKSYLMMFAVYDQNNYSRCWNEVEDDSITLGIPTVPVLWDGRLKDFPPDFHKTLDLTKQEGYVIRNLNSFHQDQFKENVAKWVRPNHITTDTHWSKTWVKNGLACKS